jgi:hypothetical protein
VAIDAAATTSPPANTGRGRRIAVNVVIAIALGAVAVASIVLLDPLIAGGMLLTLSAVFILRRFIFTWTSMLFLLGAVVMFIPIRRYALPIQVGFALEPFRAVIAGLLVALAIAAFASRSFRWKPVVWGWPIAIFLWTMLASLMFNGVELSSTPLIGAGLSNITQLAFMLSVVLIVRQLLSTERITNIFLIFLVISGAVLGFFALFERVTRTNVFLLLGNFLPLTILRDDAESLRAGGARAYASSQHPIALSVVFCMLIPIAIYLMKFAIWPRFEASRRIFYTAMIGLMLVGLLAAISRTGVVVMGVMWLFTLLSRPRLALILAAMGLPMVVVAGLLFPKNIESMLLSLLDVQGVVASQTTSVGMAGQGRLADLGPAFAEVAVNPWFGTGLGSRIVVGDFANAYILDNQWLGTLMETGVLGVIGLIALLVWPAIRMTRFAFTSHAPQSRVFLVFAIATSTIGYLTAMFFYDAFSFMQALLLLAILYAVAAWAMTEGSESWDADRALADRVERPAAVS